MSSPKPLYDHTTLLLNLSSDLLSLEKHSRLNIPDISTMLKVTFCTELSWQQPQWERRKFTCLADTADSKPVPQQVTEKQNIYSPAATTGSNPSYTEIGTDSEGSLTQDRHSTCKLCLSQNSHLEMEQLSKNQPQKTRLNQLILISGTCS